MKIDKKTITVGIATVLGTLILEKIFNPVLELIYSTFLKIGNSVMSSFSDSVYQRISEGYSEQSAQFVIYLLVIFFVLILSVVKSYFETIAAERMENYDAVEKACDSIPKTSASEDMLVLTSLDANQLQQTIKDLTAKCDDMHCELETQKQNLKLIAQKSKKSLKKFISLIKVSIYFLMFLLVFMYGKQLFINSCITKTMCNIEIVSPYVDETEYRRFKSEFHLIESRDDYDALHSKLSSIAEKYELKLK